MVNTPRHHQNPAMDDDTASNDSRHERSTSNRQMTIDDTYLDSVKRHQLDAELLPIEGLSIGASIDDRTSDQPHNDHRSSTQGAYYRLTTDELRSIADLRSRLRDQLPPTYDTDFNLYRWLKSVDRTSRHSGNIDASEKLLRNHLRFRRALGLDVKRIPTWDENPMFARRYLPRGSLTYMPSNNKFLWWVDYSSIDMGGIMNTVTSTDMLVWHFWKYEHMLRMVNECEARTRALSGIHMIMDVREYDMNPFSMMLTTNGGMTYFAQLIHYEHYPELTSPVNIINVAKWLMLPYKLIRSVMPKDFNDRIRVSDNNYKDALTEDIDEMEIPTALGGKKQTTRDMETIKAEKLDPSGYYSLRQHEEDPAQDRITQLQVAARKRKMIPIDCRAGAKLSWWFRTDADVYFGVFFSPSNEDGDEKKLSSLKRKDNMLDTLDMVHPYFRLLTKLIPERGEHTCEKTGTYYLVFCNKASWVYRRNIQVKIDIDEQAYERRRVLERAVSIQ